jgi:arsenate reductase
MSSPPATPNPIADGGSAQRVRIYHNPQCARSREALEYLQQHGIEHEVVEYLLNPLTVEELRQLVRMMCIAPSSLIRVADFKRLGLSPTSDYEKLLELLAANPAIMDRPIIVAGSEGRIGRPIENLHGLFSNAPIRRKS